MTQVMLCRASNFHLAPADDDAREYVGRMRMGEPVLCSMRLPRNPALHRKFFAMLDFAFSHWDPPELTFGGAVIEKNRDAFRRELTIAAGYYELVQGINGALQLEAKSIKWERMGNEEFSRLYEAVVRVLERSFMPGITAELMESWAEQHREAA